MFRQACKFNCKILLLLIINQFAYAADCVSSELAGKIEEAIGNSSKIFTSGKHVETQVLGRTVLQLKGGVEVGRPSYVSPKVNEFILKRIENGETNLDLMKLGKSPIGPDGKQIELHHLTGEEPGMIAEITKSEHSLNHKVLHAMIQKSFRRDPQKRYQYEKFRENYWMQRAIELE